MLDLKGGKELQQLLDQLPAKIEANILRGGLRAGAKVLLNAVKESAPVDSGDLKASVRISTALKNGQVSVFVKVGNQKAWYAHIVEFGAAPHEMRSRRANYEKTGDYRGLTVVDRLHPGARPNPFVRSAYDANEQQAVDAAVDYMRNRLKTKHGLETPDNDET